MQAGLVAALSAFALDYRHALAILDSEYREWRPEGRPRHRLDFVAGVPLLMDETNQVCHLLGELCEAAAPSVGSFVAERRPSELNVVGDANFRLLRDRLADGQWRHSRNYEATAGGFLARPCGAVRRLTPDDRTLLDAAGRRFPSFAGSRSTLRDFDFMAEGLPVVCYGAIVRGHLVGFCSANPICRGVTEISWIVVAEEHRRRGMASGLLTAQTVELFARGDCAAYCAGSAGMDLHGMLMALGFREAKGNYRFIPSSTPEQWRASWGLPV